MLLNNSNGFSWAALAIMMGSLFTVTSQFLPGMTLVFAIVWVSFLVYEGLRYRREILLGRIAIAYCGLYIAIGLYSASRFLMTGVDGYINGFFLLLSKTMLMYFVGIVSFTAIENSISNNSIRHVLIFYSICAGIYAIWALLTYFPGLNAWMTNMEYLFASKNSLGQICGVGAVALFCLSFEEKNKWCRIVELLGGGLLWLVTLLFQCRTATLGVALATLVLMFLKRKKAMLLVVLLVAAICISLLPPAQSILSHALLLDKASAGADLSSGRIGFWADSLIAIKGNELFGLGDYYVDNMYINLLVNVGAVGAIAPLAIWISRLVINFRRSVDSHIRASISCQKWLLDLETALSVFYIVESFLEGNPPFGPGACSFMFWMLCGYTDASLSVSKNKGEDR